MSKKMQSDKIIRGNYGKVWINEELFSNVIEFEANVKGDWKEVSQCGSLGEGRRFMGFKAEGKMKMHKIDSSLAILLADGFKTGNIPSIKIVAKLEDPTAYGAERISLTGVTFDDLGLLNFKNKEPGEEEISFQFEDYEYLDLIK